MDNIRIFIFIILVLNSTSIYSQTEICNNEIDDDSDGLIDCFDPDCQANAECRDFYYQGSENSCSEQFPLSQLSFWQTYTSDHVWHEYNLPIIGDIDNDGQNEFIGKKGPHVPGVYLVSEMVVLNAETGNLETTFPTHGKIPYSISATSIADVDENGYAEIYVITMDHVNDNDANLECYEYDGTSYTLKWEYRNGLTNILSDWGQSSSIIIHDLDSDGTPEVIAVDKVFNSTSGELLLDLDVISSVQGHYFASNDLSKTAVSVAYDVLPDAECTLCEGLEIIIDNKVFAVDLDLSKPMNQRATLERSFANTEKGFVSIADIDNDGSLDAVISRYLNSSASIDVVDIISGLKKYSYSWSASSAIGMPSLSDLDNNGTVEIMLTIKNNLKVFSIDSGSLSEIYNASISDGSGRTGITAFDFNKDGLKEIIYRDERYLSVFDIFNNETVIERGCSSGTGVEYPLIVDVDKDGETELVCSCGPSIMTFESFSFPWGGSRSVWNQHSFYNTNINDDLTVPIHQQDLLKLPVNDLNMFMNPYSKKNPLPDGIVSYRSSNCLQDSFKLIFEICNEGDAPLLSETPIIFVLGDPMSDTVTVYNEFNQGQEWEIGQLLMPGECMDFNIVVDKPISENFYLVVNADPNLPFPSGGISELPNTTFKECIYINNFTQLVDLSSPLRETVLTICNDDSLIYKGIIFNKFHDTDSLYLASNFGCDTLERISIDWLPSYTSDLELELCTGETYINGIDTFEINRPTGTVILENSSQTGCDSILNVSIDFLPASTSNLDISLCQDERYIIGTDTFDINRPTGAVTLESANSMGCDSVINVNLDWLLPSSSSVSIELCPEEEYVIGQDTFNAQRPTGMVVLKHANSNGCDSILNIDLSFLDTILVPIDTSFCTGDLISIFGTDIVEPGQVTIYHNTSDGCTEEWAINSRWWPPLDPAITITQPDCKNPENLLGSIDISSADRLNFLTFTDSTINYTGAPIHFENLSSGNYPMLLVDSFGCRYFDTIEILETGIIKGTIATGDSVEYGEFTRLEPFITDGILDAFQWSESGILEWNPLVQIQSDTTFEVVVWDANGCSDTIQARYFISKNYGYYAPNVFSPNGDGSNDGFTIFGKNIERILSLMIYDRWGELVYAGENMPVGIPGRGWDGTFRDKIMQAGVFTYIATLQVPNNQTVIINGDLTLIR